MLLTWFSWTLQDPTLFEVQQNRAAYTENFAMRSEICSRRAVRVTFRLPLGRSAWLAYPTCAQTIQYTEKRDFSWCWVSFHVPHSAIVGKSCSSLARVRWPPYLSPYMPTEPDAKLRYFIWTISQPNIELLKLLPNINYLLASMLQRKQKKMMTLLLMLLLGVIATRGERARSLPQTHSFGSSRSSSISYEWYFW